MKTWLCVACMLIASIAFSQVSIVESDRRPEPLAPLEESLAPLGVYKNVPEHLRTICVTVVAGDVFGSGTLIVREIEGKKVAFVWTAYHVIESSRIINSSGDNAITKITYNEVQIVQTPPGDMVAKSLWLNCDVIATSAENDLALLRVRLPNFFQVGVSFILNGTDVPVGTELYHCGSPLGLDMANTVTNGILASNDRIYKGMTFCQTTCAALPGSSGGILARKSDGQYVGMLTIGITGTDNFNFIVPVKRIVQWATDHGIRWAVDESVEMPNEEGMRAIKLESPPRQNLYPNGGEFDMTLPFPDGAYHPIFRIEDNNT